MTLSAGQTVIIAIMFAIGTMITRFLPFILFRGDKANHSYVQFLGKVLPYAAIGMLLVYCLKDVNIKVFPNGIPEAISILIVALLHYRNGNTFLSIGVGTIAYMLLVQTIFI